LPVIYHDKLKENSWITRGIRISCQWKRRLYLLSRKWNDLKFKIMLQILLLCSGN